MCGVYESSTFKPRRQATFNVYKALEIRVKSVMQPHRPIPLYPNPPFPSHQTCVDPPSDESEFPPIRVHASTPDPPTCSATHPRLHSDSCSSPSQLEPQSPPHRRSQLPRKGLGRNNVLNTIRVSVQQSNCKVRHQNMSTCDNTDHRMIIRIGSHQNEA